MSNSGRGARFDAYIQLDTYINPEGGVFTLLSETSVWVGLVVISIGGIAIKYIYFSHGSH
jgi:hypothetical protein